MTRYIMRWCVLVGWLSFASLPANGQTVHALVSIGCENDFLFGLAQADPGDGGIARYSVELLGIEQAEAFVTVLLRSGEPVAGFTIGGEDLHGDGTISAAQDVDNRSAILWGLGTRGMMPVAAGTFAPGADHLSFVGEISVDVFTRHGSRETVPAEVELAVAVPVCVHGDYNNNGIVEQGDLDLVLLNWGEPAVPPPDGWVNHLPDQTIDQEELDEVLLNWGHDFGPLARAASIPEPACAWLMSAGFSMFLLNACRCAVSHAGNRS